MHLTTSGFLRPTEIDENSAMEAPHLCVILHSVLRAENTVGSLIVFLIQHAFSTVCIGLGFGSGCVTQATYKPQLRDSQLGAPL